MSGDDTPHARAWLAVAVLAAAMGLLLFGAAGTMRYWQAGVPVGLPRSPLLTTLYLMRKDPALLERRMRGGPFAEREATQRLIMAFPPLGFIALLVVPALDRRFGWSSVPTYGVVAGEVLVAIGLYLVFLVCRANTFTSATVEVAVERTVITTGPMRSCAMRCTRAPHSICVDTARAWLVLGSPRPRGHDAVPDMADRRRGESPRQGIAEIHGVPAASPTSSRAIDRVSNA
jgi:hypothetical protein